MASLSVGIVGLPNAGKSTLFNALLKKQIAQTAAFPFCTIEPNVGIVPVPDPRLDQISQISQSQKKTPTALKFIDIAGLVKGAHQGKGLGNQFLSHIREVDLILEVVREFENKNVAHPEGKINPASDQTLIELELIIADQQSSDKAIKKLAKQIRGKTDKTKTQKLSVLKKISLWLNQGKPIRALSLSPEEEDLIKEFCFLTAKPLLAIFNISEKHLGKQKDNDARICISAKLEAEMASLSSKEAESFWQEFGLKQSGLNRIIREAYQKLDLITFFTSGPKESRAWTIRRGTKAPQAAGKIHSDFEKGFIRAEVISFSNFIDAGGETKAKEKGWSKTEGKEYLVKDGDVVHFYFH